MRSSADAAIDALASGAETFRSNGSGEPADCTGAIVGPIEFLLCLDGREHADHIARRLGEVQRGFEQQLVKAAISEFDGDVRGAAGAYETAARLDETNAAPLLLAGDLWFAAGELERALEAFRRASAIVPENLGALLGMIDVYAAQDDDWHVSEIYERVFSIAPELRSEKKAVKAYKKSCKKANRPVQVV